MRPRGACPSCSRSRTRCPATTSTCHTKAEGTSTTSTAWAGDGHGRHARAGLLQLRRRRWHLVALNSNDGCKAVACDAGSPQHAWLAADLAAHPARCTLAYWHHPRFQAGASSRRRGQHRAAVGHALRRRRRPGPHRARAQLPAAAPLDKRASATARAAIRSFVVGTGGAGFHKTFGGPHEWALEARVVDTHGVLELTLLDDGYRWRFVTVDGTVPDGASGSARAIRLGGLGPRPRAEDPHEALMRVVD